MAAWWHRAPPAPLPADALLDRLWARFAEEVPAATTFARLARLFGNDHLAFCTLARPGSGLAMMAPVFERRGWVATESWALEPEPVRALQLSRDGYARVLLMELDPTTLGSAARAALSRLPADAPPPDDDQALAAWFKAPLPPSGADLEVLQRASPLGAWLLAHGRRVHHFGVAVADLDEWQRRLAAEGVLFSDSGPGPVDAPLRRLATRPVEREVRLRNGRHRRLPWAHLELVERQPGFDGLQAAPLPTTGAEGRRHPRVDTTLQVELGYGALRVPVVSENVSLGGMFLQLPDEDAPATHTTLQLKIELPDGAIDAVATVIFAVPGRGVGVEFQWWDDDASAERRALADYLGSLS